MSYYPLHNYCQVQKTEVTVPLMQMGPKSYPRARGRRRPPPRTLTKAHRSFSP